MAPTGALTPKQAGYNVVQTPRYSPQVMQQIEQLRGRVEPGALRGIDQISRLAMGDEGQFAQLEAPALRQFGELQGSLASRFSGPGTGARRSSGFQNTMSGAAGDLAERLQSQRMGLQQNAIQQLLGLYGGLVKDDPYEMMLQERKRKNSWGDALSGAVSGATAGSAFGPWGTAAGGLIGGTTGFFSGR